MADLWFTLLRWLLLLGLAIGLGAIPTVYVNHRIDAAYTQGEKDGRASCVADYAAQAIKDQARRAAQMLEEVERADKLQTKLDNSERTGNVLRDRLAKELAKNPPPATCVLSKSATDSLRNLANGSAFSGDEGESVPSPFDPEVSKRPSAEGDRPTRHGG